MRAKIQVLFFAFPLIILFCGCTTTPPFEVDRYDFQIFNQNEKIVIEHNEKFACYENKDFKITMAIFRHQNLYVVPLSITNKTGTNLLPARYSVGLYDGRDYKPLTFVHRSDIIAYKNKVAGIGSVNLTPTIENAFNAATSLINWPSSSALNKGLDQAIENYFEFRPVWANQKRYGILCYVGNFKLEYPLSFIVKIRGEKMEFEFLPRPKDEPKDSSEKSELN